jgi:hypothetical protein
MTRDDAVSILTTCWGGCQDAFGLVIALEQLGVLKIDPTKTKRLLDQAQKYRRPGAAVEVSVKETGEMASLIIELSRELEMRALDSKTKSPPYEA